MDNAQSSVFRAEIDHADTKPSLIYILNDLSGLILLLNLPPEFIHVTVHFRRMQANIVQCYQSALPDQRRIHFKIRFDTLIGMVAINEQEINSLGRENF